ncbi:MAG: MATE family efflux transporter [Paludibacteraceae bacterium]|nr:MATE family efflux transporter [Paludibacteraceae bacterium]MBO7259380.1 MATE family efflux transporter [Paludibacteraceae bacterium]
MSKKLPLTLGTEPVKKLLRAYAMPSIIAMTASSLYNMVDSIFIGHGVGELALSGLAVTFPLMNLAAAFGSLVGVGASTLISVKLGQKDYKTAQQVLGNVFVLNLIIGVCFTTLSLAFLEPILRFFGASENTLPYAKDYMTIILLGNVITHIYLGLNAVLRSSGHPRLSMYATITTVLLNAILDPIFIFVFDWGIKGAAIATILAQIIALAWQCKLFANPNELLHFHKGIFRLKKRIVMDSFSIGMAPFLMNLASCFIVILINNGLGRYGGDLAIGAYGIVNRVVFLFIMVVMGLNQGMQPIAGYNYGAQQMQRVMEVLKVTILYATMVMTLGFVVGEFMPEWVARVFTSEKELIRLAADGMRVIMFVFPVIGFQMVVSNFFQSIGMARQSIFLSLTRQVLFLIPLLIILPRYWGMTGVWISMPISDFIASVVAAGMLLHKMKNNKLHQPTM